MGWNGPIPKRSEERRRRNRPTGPDLLRLPTGPTSALPDIAPPDEAWHATARAWYLSLQKSAQAALYEPSDWAKARYVADLMSRSLAGPPNAHLVQGLRQAMASLLTTEGDRRRAGVETGRT